MLKTRIITALVLLPLMLAALFFFPPAAWAAFSWLIIVLAMWEYARMAAIRGMQQWLYLGGSTLLAAAAWFSGFVPDGTMMVISLLVWLVLAPLWLRKRWAIPGGVPAMVLGWLLMFPAWFAFLAWHPDSSAVSGKQLLAVMGLVWVADVAAYFAGKAFGKHKLAPAVSPGKTIEGMLGGLFTASLLAIGVTWFMGFVPAKMGTVLLCSLLAVLASVLGDLAESMFKREAGIKDSGTLLPGHGGILDRIDSLTAALPVFLLSYLLLGPEF